MPKRKLVSGPTEADGKRHSLNMRTTREMREALERAAAKSGRSLVQEVEFRLEETFALDASIGSPETRRLLASVANRIHSIEQSFGRQWQDSDDGNLRSALIDIFAEELDTAHSDKRLARIMRLTKDYTAKYPPLPGVILLWPGTEPPSRPRAGVKYQYMDQAKIDELDQPLL